MTSEDPYYNRRLKGTKLYRYRNPFAIGVLAVSSVLAVAFNFLPHSQNLVEKIRTGAFKNTEETEARRMLIQESLTRSSNAMRRHQEDIQERPV